MGSCFWTSGWWYLESETPYCGVPPPCFASTTVPGVLFICIFCVFVVDGYVFVFVFRVECCIAPSRLAFASPFES